MIEMGVHVSTAESIQISSSGLMWLECFTTAAAAESQDV